MGFLSGLFSGKKSVVQRTTFDRSFHIENPTIGFLNFLGDDAVALLAADKEVLLPLFQSCKVSTDATPKCQVLFVYCAVETTGRIAGSQASLRDLIKDAGANVAVVISENDPDSYIKAMGTRNDRSENVVLSIDRKGEKFAPFFRNLFTAMFKGKSMLMAWIGLAPQIPGHDHPDAPGTILAAKAGHVVCNQFG